MVKAVIVKHDNSYKNFVFEVPKGANVKKGDRVVCDTRKGQDEGICISEPIYILDESPIKEFFEILTGCKFPLKKIVGVYNLEKFNKEVESDV